jgi:hypothetical protein
MRIVAAATVLVFTLAGCTPPTTGQLLHREVGRTIADVTLVAGQPEAFFITPEGMRGYRWTRPHLTPTGGRRCTYTLYAVREGRPRSLAAWRVVGSGLPEPGCGPLIEGEAVAGGPSKG